MRTTIEMPDELLGRARMKARESGVTLKEFFVSGVERRLTARARVRREEIDEARFG